MKRTLPLTFLLFFFAIPILRAAEIAPEGTPVRKLQRGFLNIALSPIEISRELDSEKKVDSFVPSWFSGIGRGSFYAVGRALAGVYDMLTFFAPVPAGYEPLVSPEFAWEHLPKELKSSENKKKKR